MAYSLLYPASVQHQSSWFTNQQHGALSTANRFITNQIIPCSIHLHRLSPLFLPKPYSSPGPCRAASSPPPESDPPTGEDPNPSSAGRSRPNLPTIHTSPPFMPTTHYLASSSLTTVSSGSAATFAKLQDTVQIFFAVLFWMSLFFWSSAWDGRNNGGPTKGPRFRR